MFPTTLFLVATHRLRPLTKTVGVHNKRHNMKANCQTVQETIENGEVAGIMNDLPCRKDINSVHTNFTDKCIKSK
jgi:hypothetical protein